MAVRIPKNVAEAAKLCPGDNLKLSVEGSGVVRIRKKKETSKLRDLVREITAANLHTEADWGAPEGKELS
jgi:antitoxin component of MazEF toxin-antitoxin module